MPESSEDVRMLADVLDAAAEELPSRMQNVQVAYHQAKRVAQMLRDGVAERPATCCLSECNEQATAGPLCGPHLLDFAPITCAINGCKEAGTTEDGTPLTAGVAFGEVPMCVEHYELWREAREVEGVGAVAGEPLITPTMQPSDHRQAHDALTREIAHAVLYIVDHEEAEPRSTVIDHLYGAYQDAKQIARPEPDPEVPGYYCHECRAKYAHQECCPVHSGPAEPEKS